MKLAVTIEQFRNSLENDKEPSWGVVVFFLLLRWMASHRTLNTWGSPCPTVSLPSVGSREFCFLVPVSPTGFPCRPNKRFSVCFNPFLTQVLLHQVRTRNAKGRSSFQGEINFSHSWMAVFDRIGQRPFFVSWKGGIPSVCVCVCVVCLVVSRFVYLTDRRVGLRQHSPLYLNWMALY